MTCASLKSANDSDNDVSTRVSDAIAHTSRSRASRALSTLVGPCAASYYFAVFPRRMNESASTAVNELSLASSRPRSHRPPSAGCEWDDAEARRGRRRIGRGPFYPPSSKASASYLLTCRATSLHLMKYAYLAQSLWLLVPFPPPDALGVWLTNEARNHALMDIKVTKNGRPERPEL